jgi:hypothetical protein
MRWLFIILLFIVTDVWSQSPFRETFTYSYPLVQLKFGVPDTVSVPILGIQKKIFNTDGQLTLSETYRKSEDGGKLVLSHYSTHLYDLMGRKIQDRAVALEHGMASSQVDYKYSGEDTLNFTRWLYIDDGSLHEKMIATYVSATRSGAKTYYNSDGELWYMDTYQNDDKGRVSEYVETRTGNGEKYTRTKKYTYDEVNHIVSWSTLDSRMVGKLSNFDSIISYPNKVPKRLVNYKWSLFEEGVDLVRETTFNYSNNGAIIKSEWIPGLKRKTVEIWVSQDSVINENQGDWIMERTEYDENNVVQEKLLYEYTFDLQGFWETKLEYSPKGPGQVRDPKRYWTRKLKY